MGDFGYSGEQLTSPEKIIIDLQDNFVVCDAGAGRIVKYDMFGSFVEEVILDNAGIVVLLVIQFLGGDG